MSVPRAAISALVLCLVIAAPALAKNFRVRAALAPTAADANAKGRALFLVVGSDDGRFDVRVKRLDPNATYEMIVGGVRVGVVTTNRRGRGRLRFRSVPRTDDRLLGFDPRGFTVPLRNAAGADVLIGALPPAGPGIVDGTDIVCCVPDDSGLECEDRTLAECVAESGAAVSGARSCLPNPCGTTTPPVGREIVCCIPDDSGAECEDRTTAECAAEGGVVIEATSCVGNPCPPSPAPGNDVICCVPDDAGPKCEDRTPAACAAAGGTVIPAATSCVPNPCV